MLASKIHEKCVLELLGRLLGALGGVLEHLGLILERLGGVLERLGRVLGRLGAEKAHKERARCQGRTEAVGREHPNIKEEETLHA